MASGTISLGSSGYLTGQIVWSSKSNGSTKNNSTVTASLQVKRTNSYTTTGTWTGSLNIGGTSKTFSIHDAITSSWVTLISFEITKGHNADGSGTCYIYGKANAPSGTSLGGNSVSGSKTVTLDTIARAATITSANNFNDEGKPTVKYSNPAGSAATVSVGVYWDSSTALIPYTTVTGTSGTKEFTLTTAQKNAIYSKMSTVKSKTVYYYIKTVIGGETFTSKVAKTLSITNATPTLNPTAVEDVDTSTDGGDGAGNIAATGSNMRWLSGISDIRYAFNATALKGASIKTYSVVCGSKKGSSASGVLFNVDGASVKFTVTDSRGNTATKTVSGTLINYIKPTISLGVTTALDTETTAKATLSVNGKFFNGNINTSAKNTLKAWYKYKEEGGSYSSWTAITPSVSGNSYSISYEVPNSLDYQKTYVFQIRIQDNYYLEQESYIYSAEVSVTTQPIFDWGKEDFNFNCDVNINGELSINNKWVNLTIADGFKVYGDNAKAQPKYKVCGSVVTVTGALTPTEAFTSNGTETLLATGIPSKYCPQYAQYAICQGSGMAKWTLSIKANGEVTLQRYGTSTSITDTTVSAGAWLPFTITYQF